MPENSFKTESLKKFSKPCFENHLQRFEAVRNAFLNKNFLKLRQISNKAIKEAALHNNKLLAELALIAYSLHKLYTKEHIVQHKKWQAARKKIIISFGNAGMALKEKNYNEFVKNLKKIIESINLVDEELGHYAQSIYDKARVKLAADAYYFGLSLSQACELVDADKKKVLSYIGITRLHDMEKVVFGIGERLEKIEDLLQK